MEYKVTFADGSMIDLAGEGKITAGPSKWDLQLALFDNHARAVDLTITVEQKSVYNLAGSLVRKQSEARTVVQMYITSIKREDGSGERFIIEGNPIKLDGKPIHSAGYLKFFFRTNERTGGLNFSQIARQNANV